MLGMAYDIGMTAHAIAAGYRLRCVACILSVFVTSSLEQHCYSSKDMTGNTLHGLFACESTAIMRLFS
jgi:hypothetical protein